MKVLIYAYGTRGDVQPSVALGHALVRAGHQAVLAAPARYADFAAEHGLDFVPRDEQWLSLMTDNADVRELYHGDQMKRTERQKEPFEWHKAEVLRLVPVLLEDQWNAAAGGADVIVYQDTWFTHANHVAEALGIPSVLAVQYPQSVPSWEYPSMLVPPGKKLPKALNRLSHPGAAVVQPPRRPARAVLGAAHPHDRLLVPALGRLHPARRPGRLPRRRRAAGVRRLRQHRRQGPGGDGADGAQGHRRDRGARRRRDRVGRAGLPEAPPNVHVIDQAPYDWLFPRVRAVVHAGGTGTINYALAAGLPQVACVFHHEQMMWSRNLHELGAAPAPLWMDTLESGALADAIRQATTDPAMTAAAQRAAEGMCTENGVANAVAALEAIVGRVDAKV